MADKTKFKLENMINRKYGNLQVLSYHSKNSRGVKMVSCKCDCGVETIEQATKIHRGFIKSCRDCGTRIFGKRNLIKGLDKHPLRVVWCGIKQRTLNKNNFSYRN